LGGGVKVMIKCKTCNDTGLVYIPVDMDGSPRTYQCKCEIGQLDEADDIMQELADYEMGGKNNF